MRRTSMTLGLLLLPAIAAAQSASDPVTAQLDRINATLKQIVELLNHQSDAQDLDLLMKRVQLGQSASPRAGALADEPLRPDELEREPRVRHEPALEPSRRADEQNLRARSPPADLSRERDAGEDVPAGFSRRDHVGSFRFGHP